jgi:hypothetical protein
MNLLNCYNQINESGNKTKDLVNGK